MELKLDDYTKQVRPPISQLTVHNQDGEALFVLEYDTVDKQIKFKLVDAEDITNQLIQTKSDLTTEKGVEAFGSFVSGADDNTVVSRRLLSLYYPKDDSTFDKYHITLEDTLQQVGLQNSMLLSAECYTVLIGPLTEFLEDNTISVEKYPLLDRFFHRSYQFPPFSALMQGKTYTGEELDDTKIASQESKLKTVLDQYKDITETVSLYIMTISGAIIAQKELVNSGTKLLNSVSLEHITTAATITSPGIFTTDGYSTLWFPFTKAQVGKIGRAISTTLNTLNYASSKKDMQEQVQTNIAHKSHDLIDIVARHQDDQIQGLQTNVGYLVCSIKVKDEYENDIGTILKISQEISDKAKQYGQAILARIAKDKMFTDITG